ncbi:MAG: SpoIIE family protein phosphatase [Bryobacteraceae bacterium]|nr:SpoIIE family protein phosphatase [Bryobacteraceae bacterium]MDW8377757.1 SpoIIE family protein phosphatase [Bryobacterales bacterium]
MPLRPLPFRIGRQSDNHLVLRDNRASRYHARIDCDESGYFLEDLNSRHGVLVNGVKIPGRIHLRSGDCIEFGVPDSYKIIFSVEGAELRRLMDQLNATSPPPGAASANLAKLRALVEVARAVQSSLSTQSVLSAVVDAAITVTGADRGFLLLRQGRRLEVAVARDSRGLMIPASERNLPTQLLERVLASRADLLALNFDLRKQIQRDPDFTTSQLESRNCVCVPLMQARPGAGSEETLVLNAVQDTMGVLYLESKLGASDLTAGDHELLQTLAAEASTILENARLIEQERLRQKMDEELKIAREIQQSLMPRQLPQKGWFRAAAANIPSHQVGGDYCDVRQIAPEAWAFVVADVSGKGVSSALLASLLQGAFLAGGNAAARMDVLMSHVNQFLVERTEGEKYATLFCGVLSRDGRLRWSNAGHCPPLLLRADGEIIHLEATSMPLGMIEGAEFTVRETTLHTGDKLLLYTDGVTEAQNSQRQFFELRRLESLVRAHAAESCQALIDTVIQAVEAFTEGVPQTDDLTAVVIEYAPEVGDQAPALNSSQLRQ